MTAKTAAGAGKTERTLNWPGEPDGVTAADVDFEALAHVLANTCRRGGRMRHYHSLAAHAAIVSEEIEALDGLGEDERRVLALHALLGGAASAWFRGEWTGSARAAERTAKLASGIERAVREAAGLEPVLDEERAELLRFVARMTTAAESRDLGEDDAPRGRRRRVPAVEAPYPLRCAGPGGARLARAVPGACGRCGRQEAGRVRRERRRVRRRRQTGHPGGVTWRGATTTPPGR